MGKTKKSRKKQKKDKSEDVLSWKGLFAELRYQYYNFIEGRPIVNGKELLAKYLAKGLFKFKIIFSYLYTSIFVLLLLFLKGYKINLMNYLGAIAIVYICNKSLIKIQQLLKGELS